MRNTVLIIFTLIIISCKTPTERWISGLADFNEVKSDAMRLDVMKIEAKHDTSVLNYRVRIYIDKAWLENNATNNINELNYKADSSFFISTGQAKYRPQFVQPVADGIKNCYEYLVSFNADNHIKMKRLQLVYEDKYIDGQIHTLNLEKQ